MTTDEAKAHYGGATGLAKALDVTVSAVSQWGEHPPRLQQLELEAMTKGELKAEPKPEKKP